MNTQSWYNPYVWPLIVVILNIWYRVYRALHPCTPGLVVIDCPLERFFIAIGSLFTIVQYVLLILLLKRILRKKNYSISLQVYLLLGTATIILPVFGMLFPNHFLSEFVLILYGQFLLAMLALLHALPINIQQLILSVI
jgi:hypothetical protein